MTASHSEYVVRTGPENGPAVLFILPFFDEANRMRRTVRLAMAHLAQAGIGAILPDLPGQNESLIAVKDVTMNDWRDALASFAAHLDRPYISASFRGGCLIDDAAGGAAAWRCAPARGAHILRTMLRTRIASDKEAGIISTQDGLIASANAAPLELGGNLLSAAMLAQLQAAEVADLPNCRSVSLNPDDAEHITGSPLWLRAEPGEDTAFASAIASDIIAWGRTCGVI
jgi:pimeloyl-ACP methyl ester carboxylesterase